MLPLTKIKIKITPRCDRMLNLWKKILKRFANDKNYRKVREHCHFTGKYKGAAHSICNLKFNVSNEIPVLSFNYKRISKRVSGKIWTSLGKCRKVQKFFCFNRKRGYKSCK